ncbi:NrfD/PsrC family molybdoenzyme membrane anchor subunit [Photobacterium minamisatsumaniensis]|uniref:NrfD/PsrC family molybdoenzyme membrane anchor subunit n=1 Tax=Photobacterium minamisatsumaniensis TaxID=2910233 RepID=UPI003D0A00B3
MNITEVLVPPQAIAWLPWAVQYFFYIGSAYAAAILFFIALIFQKQTSHQLRAALVLTVAISAIVGPLALTGDLHQPGRAWHFYAHFTPWSWMSMGAIFLPIFSGLAIATAWLYLRDDLICLKNSKSKFFQTLSMLSLGNWKTTRKTMISMAALTVISGLTIATYTGAEIATIEARPLWHQPASPLLWFTTAFLGAVGFTLIIWFLLPAKAQHKTLTYSDLRLLKQTVILSCISALLLIPLWGTNNPTFSLYSDSQWLINIGLLSMVLLGSILLAVITLRENYRTAGLILMSFITLCGAWAIRWITIMEAQTIPKFDVGPYPYELPMNSTGLLGILGMLGLWIALGMIGSELVQSKNTQSSHASVSEH